MVSIHHTPQGWTLVRSENLGYYTSLGDVMDAAYAATKSQKCYTKTGRETLSIHFYRSSQEDNS